MIETIKMVKTITAKPKKLRFVAKTNFLSVFCHLLSSLLFKFTFETRIPISYLFTLKMSNK